MSMSWALFDTKAKRAREAIEAMEAAVQTQRTKTHEAQDRLRETMKVATAELTRLPIADSLVWKGRRDV